MSLPLLPKSTLDRESAPPVTLELSIGKPSTTIKAWLLPAIEEPPRKTTREELPGVDELDVMLTPATLPANELIALGLPPWVNSSAFTVGAEYPNDLFSLTIALAVTTTSDSALASETKTTSITALSAVIVCEV